ncbi:hypothetical protein J2Y58_001380 [Sphingomonas sp. BE138]|uniref:hypothetical protein n=1 Tax=Sphingomonas sp. BE138 TaxID=2817845 RepID=UPI002864E690|nr:hypothetical protein [Sphingomonas sp. BE138]MDR6788028.1 hypothetical protein [Sphingomonas sp. BE138]
MTIGNVVCARAADRAMVPAIGGTLAFNVGAGVPSALLAREPAAHAFSDRCRG